MITTKNDARLSPILARLRDAALGYPEAVEEFPWGDRVAKVRGKIFVFLNLHEGKLVVTAKLPQSGEAALLLPFAAPTGYNLGKSGWVTARFGPKERVPEAMLLEWIEESYRAVAPQRALRTMEGATGKGAGASERAGEGNKGAAAGKKVAAKKGAAAGKKAGAKKGAAAGEKVAAKKGAVAKRGAAVGEKVAAKKGAVAKRGAVAKKGAAAKKGVRREPASGKKSPLAQRNRK
ncbi:MmcQ/YjbR family DNA-binding protein [Sorangium sp. So ce542]|uniref:MmcQ/YjbR family DNA-binding protein n=1 Tax=Sorangium sp. So ce542 TaxID=3133316 RepID=UPI003F63E960